MNKYLIIEGDALDMLRMRRQSAMDKSSGKSSGPAANEPMKEPDEPLDRPFEGEDEWYKEGEGLRYLDGSTDEDEPLDVPAEPDFGGEDEPLGFAGDSMGETPDAGMTDDDALAATSDFDDWARGHNAKLPNEVKPQEPPEPDAAGGYTEEPVEMPWSGHAVQGNADFGPDHDTEESSIIDGGGEKDEFRGGHVEGYPEEEEEGFGETPED